MTSKKILKYFILQNVTLFLINWYVQGNLNWLNPFLDTTKARIDYLAWLTIAEVAILFILTPINIFIQDKVNKFL